MRLRVPMERKFYSSLRGLIRPFLTHTGGIGLLIHMVHKFASESYYDFPTFECLEGEG
jgi:hypothetical protein